MVQFSSFSLPASVLAALSEMGFTEPSPIQADVIPLLLEGRDVIGQAQTGTGKTAAFGIPLVVAALESRLSLVLVPTRELAQQVAGEIDRIGKHAGVLALPLYGGAAFGPQARALEDGHHRVLVATPGRLRDHIERGTLDPAQAAIVVLDEADEMLKMGFVEEVTAVLDAVGPERQTLLFSATMPPAVASLAQRYLRAPEHVVAERPNDSLAAANTEQLAIAVRHNGKVDALVRILAVERPSATLVFRHTRESVDDLVRELATRGLAAEALHGGMAQPERDRVLVRLRAGRGLVVVATNVAARGLDVDVITHVVNFDAPREAESYVHRIGRTGRAGRDGRSFLFVTPADRNRLRSIERGLGARIAWHNIPTDAEVRAATARHAAGWITERAGPASREHLATIDAALATGRDPRELAASLFGLLAAHEGLAPPTLEALATIAPPAPSDAPRVALTMNVGRDDGLRPADVVGALTNEGGLVGADVGRIDILPRMAVAEVPSDRLEDVIRNMSSTTLRGRPVRMRVADRWQFRTPPRTAMRAR